MTKYRKHLPQTNGKDVFASWGLGTWLQFAEGFEAPNFATFLWLDDPKAVAALKRYHSNAIETALPYDFGYLTEGLHFRASKEWGDLMGYSKAALKEANFKGVEFCRDLAKEYETPEFPVVLCASIGPRGDAYNIGRTPDAVEAEDYHSEQISWLKEAGADLIVAATFSSAEEAIGVVRASAAMEMPVSVSFTLTADGTTASGLTLRQSIEKTDAATGGVVTYFTTNCSHPLEFAPALEGGDWIKRLHGVIPNAVSLDKGKLCKLGHLEDGDPVELGQQIGALAKRHPHMRVWGGCCGTDARHIGEIARNVAEARAG